MSQDVFKVPKSKRRHGSHHKTDFLHWSPPKRRRTKEDFFSFCNIVLEYEQYDSLKHEDLRAHNNTSPLDSIGSTAESFTSDSTSSSISETEPDDKHLLMLNHSGQSSPGSSSTSSTHSNHDYPQRLLHRGNASKMAAGDVESDEDSYELITCFCMKPFAGRPMIECSECYTWIHLSCAKIRKSNIPEEFTCQKCKEAKFTTRKSNRIRSEKRPLNA